jgi:hypothetical protein
MPLDPESWSTLLGSAAAGFPLPALADELIPWWDSTASALELYRMLVCENRASTVAAAAPRTTRILLMQHGAAATRRLLAEFWQQSTQAYTAADEARAFIRFLMTAHPTLLGVADAAALDIAKLADLGV